jgi:glycosyltransferase involved in cell wall biosynthesis
MKPGGILLIWDRMGDYHRARWKALQEHIPAVDVYAADLVGSDRLYSWNSTANDSHYVRLSNSPPDKFDIKRIVRFIRFLSTSNIATICVAGYGRPEYIFFLVWGRVTGRKVIMFAESWYPSSSIFDKLKALLIRSCCHGVLVSGERALKHFSQRFNLSQKRLKIGYSVVDNTHFSNAAPSQQRLQLLCIARFATEKNLQLLIRSFCNSSLATSNWELKLVGGGPLEPELRSAAEGKPVTVLSWQSYDDLPRLYSEASVFVLPSVFEPWGLVVNEAMASGLPVVLSREVGCMPDLLREGHNGWAFTGTHEGELTRIFDKIAALTPAQLKEMGNASKAIIDTYSLGFFASNLKGLILPDDAG